MDGVSLGQRHATREHVVALRRAGLKRQEREEQRCGGSIRIRLAPRVGEAQRARGRGVPAAGFGLTRVEGVHLRRRRGAREGDDDARAVPTAAPEARLHEAGRCLDDADVGRAGRRGREDPIAAQLVQPTVARSPSACFRNRRARPRLPRATPLLAGGDAGSQRRACVARTSQRLGYFASTVRCPRQESNLCTRFRKPLLYPLSYGGELAQPCGVARLSDLSTLTAVSVFSLARRWRR